MSLESDVEFYGEDKIIRGRPDFGNPGFGHTEAKKSPKYVYSPRQGMLVHKVAKTSMAWYRVGPPGDHLIRLDSPRIVYFTICGQMCFPGKARSVTCAVPDPNAVLCGRCHGEGPVFPKNRPWKVTKREAHDRLGCVAYVE